MKFLPVLFLLFLTLGAQAQVKIGDDPNTINPASILEIADTTRGVLIPRMTTTQRDSISSPPDGLQVYNITTNTMDVYRSDNWASTAYTKPDDRLVYVYSLADLPAPSGSTITLDANSMYIFKGIVDITPYYLELNGANLRGIDPARDGVTSAVGGAILRSTDVSVFMQDLVVIPLSGSTKAYDFRDATKTKFCNLFSGNSVVEIGIPSLGVGQISGFKAATIVKNYWSCSDGLKVTGNMGKFACAFTFITNVTSGAGIEFLGTLVIDDIDLSNNYFVYNGQSGVKLNAGAVVDRGRMTTNMFRDVATPLMGLDSYTAGWSMRQNTNIPDSRAFSFIYFSGNSTVTSLPSAYPFFYKIAGATTTIDEKRFSASDNKITYNGVDPLSGKVSIVISAKAPANNSDFSIGLGKNAAALIAPVSSMAAASNGQSFQIILNAEVDLVSGDYLEVYITRNNNNTSSIKVEELQFRVTD
ncbi:hypothetical protein G3O08_12865 [Cryomorpha ignava]|uniref:Uncharacterized protein n=1 Tax=Cryomorpha ignava TaxID=101383 RepID=A0A7K3WUQ3_9FLAO|nr:hypothetical protein [Cryomorpha ignava]NEN24395.1 hypothetical protein [Cryomorpha ignava]